jgi:hypothetical protein
VDRQAGRAWTRYHRDREARRGPKPVHSNGPITKMTLASPLAHRLPSESDTRTFSDTAARGTSHAMADPAMSGAWEPHGTCMRVGHHSGKIRHFPRPPIALVLREVLTGTIETETAKITLHPKSTAGEPKGFSMTLKQMRCGARSNPTPTNRAAPTHAPLKPSRITHSNLICSHHVSGPRQRRRRSNAKKRRARQSCSSSSMVSQGSSPYNHSSRHPNSTPIHPQRCPHPYLAPCTPYSTSISHISYAYGTTTSQSTF